jgi:hypothetical protein
MIALYLVYVTIPCVAKFFNTQAIFSYFIKVTVRSLFLSQPLTDLSILHKLERNVNVMYSCVVHIVKLSPVEESIWKASKCLNVPT